ncbi:Hypothetical predicted protein [Pelobates cultripes]|uniref:Uncharacterized protein n=1 Tax=Pelobates cultripes TaxID=61616 RepID=A0AAD1SBN2_PELCU|nr:Hypothetical predicted protein [Pelobates cultripes]
MDVTSVDSMLCRCFPSPLFVQPGGKSYAGLREGVTFVRLLLSVGRHFSSQARGVQCEVGVILGLCVVVILSGGDQDNPPGPWGGSGVHEAYLKASTWQAGSQTGRWLSVPLSTLIGRRPQSLLSPTGGSETPDLGDRGGSGVCSDTCDSFWSPRLL